MSKKALEVNRSRAKEENIRNISFTSYDGINVPFEDSEFDMVISRYALHHFPNIQKSILRLVGLQGKEVSYLFQTQHLTSMIPADL